MFRCKRTFWLENPTELICDYRVVPTDTMDLSKQLNSITRLIIFITLILYLIGYKNATLFALLSLTTIITIYYVQKDSKNLKEGYKFPANNKMSTPQQKLEQLKTQYEYTYGNANIYTGEVPIEYGSGKFYQYNHALAGKPNPKTLKAPVIPPRSADLDVWRSNDFVKHSAVNDDRRVFLYENGYIAKETCNDVNPPIFENYDNPKTMNRRKLAQEISSRNRSNLTEFYNQPENKYDNINSGYDLPNQTPDQDQFFIYKKNTGFNLSPGDVNTTCCYKPENVKYNIPVNYEESNMEKLPSFRNFNENIWTMNVGPDAVDKLEIIEPISSNIGISFDQQIPPTTKTTKDGKDFFVRHNPRTFTIPEVDIVDPFSEQPKPETVYDPRLTGYGTAYRSYIDKMTGQARFYYDDVNAARRGNYYVRSKVDFLPEAEQSGIMKSNENILELNKNIRSVANQAFTDNTLKFREELQYSYMRKRNSDMWQKRVAPINTMGCKGNCTI